MKLVNAIIDLVTEVTTSRRLIRQVRDNIERKHREILIHMATQEERLQAIFVAVSAAVALLKTLKTNNPDIEDEITEIENKLAEVAPATPPAADPDPGDINNPPV